MTTVEDPDRKLARGQAVDEAYQALEKHLVGRGRIVFLPDDHKRAGGYGIVRKAHLHPSAYLPTWVASRRYGPPQVVAVKQIKISAVDNVADVKRAFTKEMLVWSSLEAHRGMTRFLGFYANQELSEAWLLSPWEPYGNVSEFIRGHNLEVPEKLSLIYDTIDALVFLHQLNPPVCHGDVKSANVLVNSKFRAVLCDFGLARLHEDSGFGRLETSTGFKGSIRWCSPELINGHPRTPSSDVYAWAWLVWEIMTGELPYEGTLADYAIILKIFEGPRPHADGEFRLTDCLQLWELMTRCWAAVPEQRPTSNMCLTTVTSLPRCPPTLSNETRSAALLENLGDLESWKGNYEEGLAYMEQALLMYEEEGNHRGIASVLRKQAAASYRHSYPVNALKAATAALEKLRTLSDPLGTAETLSLIGSSLCLQSKNEDAMAFLNEALEIFRAHTNDVGIVGCLERIGELHRRKGDPPKALLILEEAVTIASRCGDKLGEAKVRVVLGAVTHDQDDLDGAASIYLEVRDLAGRIGWEHGVGRALLCLGNIRRAQGRGAEAEELARESTAVSRRSNAPWRLAQGLWVLANCLRDQGRLDEAAAALEESFSIYAEISHGDWELPYTASLLAAVKKDHGATADALYWYDVAIAEYRRLEDKSEMSRCLADKALILEEQEKYDEAALHFEASLVLDSELQDNQGVRWNRRKLGKTQKAAIVWESRKFAKPKRLGTQHALPLLCDVKKLQRRIPHLRTSSLRLEIQVNERVDF